MDRRSENGEPYPFRIVNEVKLLARKAAEAYEEARNPLIGKASLLLVYIVLKDVIKHQREKFPG